jgi:hypothetical protein
MPGMIFTRLLGENCSSSNARAIGFELKWEIVVREYQDGAKVMSPLSFVKESSWGRPQMNLTSFMVRSNSVWA